MHWKSDMALYTPALLPGLTLHDFFRNALKQTFEDCTDAEGHIGSYGWENKAAVLTALHAHLLATGDWDFAREHLPVLKRILRAALARDLDGDGLLEAPFHGNRFEENRASLNWWDDFAFGHKDAFANLVYHQAFRRIGGVLRGLGETALSDELAAFTARTRRRFHSTFFNSKSGLYAGWISLDGRMHDYAFTFITAMAVTEGLVPGTRRARAMMKRLLVLLDQQGYGEFRYGVPGPARPVAPEDRTQWPPMSDWGRYENGGFCGQTAYPFLMALYATGLRAEADRILFNMLDTFERLPTHSGLNPGYCKSWDWRTKDGLPCGYNYLADNYVFLLAAVQGHFHAPLPALPPVR
jgi:hypothetical protein